MKITVKILSCLILIIVSLNAYAEPDFSVSSGVLNLPTVRVDGSLYRNVKIILRNDGTWGLQSIEEQPTTTNPICGIPRETARNDILADLTETYSPSFSLIESLLQSNMESYDAICAMNETPVLLEILNDRSKTYYPSFSLILSLTQSDLESFANLQK